MKNETPSRTEVSESFRTIVMFCSFTCIRHEFYIARSLKITQTLGTPANSKRLSNSGCFLRPTVSDFSNFFHSRLPVLSRKQEVLDIFLFLCLLSSVCSGPNLYKVVLTKWPTSLVVGGWTASSSLICQISHGYIYTYIHSDAHVYIYLHLLLLYFDLRPGQKCHSKVMHRKEVTHSDGSYERKSRGRKLADEMGQVKKIPMVHS